MLLQEVVARPPRGIKMDLPRDLRARPSSEGSGREEVSFLNMHVVFWEQTRMDFQPGFDFWWSILLLEAQVCQGCNTNNFQSCFLKSHSWTCWLTGSKKKLALGAEILSSKKGRRKVATKAEGGREDLFRPIGCPVDRGEMCI